MSKRYVYKNLRKTPVNIGGCQFKEGQELESDVLIGGFNEAVSDGYLDLIDRKHEGRGQNATQAPQTGDTGKVKVVFHIIFNDEPEVVQESEAAPNIPIAFPDIDSREDKILDGWFKDAEFIKPVNASKAKSPKKGEIHFYGKWSPKPEGPHRDMNPDEPPKPNDDAGSEQEKGLAVFPSLPPPPIDDEAVATGSESK